MRAMNVNPRDPKFLGFWTRCIRETSHWSQEALAASSGLDPRTIQRIEAGKPVSTTTRRALARGLGYDNADVFDDPEFIKAVHALFDDLQKMQDEEVQKQFPDHVRVTVTRVSTGETMAKLAYDSDCYLFNSDDAISPEAKEIAASIFDYMRDLGDVGDEVSFANKLSYQRELDGMLKELEGHGTACYIASRAIKAVGAHWIDKTPIPLTIGYLTVVPAENILTEMMVPRRIS
jgi:transcriptional regulator with XRE-family HTH domain